MSGETDGLRIKGGVREVVRQMAVQAEKAPKTMEEVRQQSPSIAEAMEALNPKLRRIAAEGQPVV